VLDPYVREGNLIFVTREGARLDLELRVALRIDADGIRELWSGIDESDPLQRLDRAVDEFLVGRLRDLTDGSIPRLDDASRSSMAEALSQFGKLEGPLVLEFRADSPVTSALRSSREWERIRELEQQTDVRVLIVGMDGMDWQIADPLIEQGLLPNLAGLRARGAWGNVKALMPILSPLLWTSIATGVSPDRHGVVDFLVPDPNTGQPVPIDSRARKVRALWNLYTEAGRTVDVVAWWASWPAESINGHLVSDRVSYSLFDFEAPPDGHGITHPPEYFDRIRPELITDDAIGYDEVTRFVDITKDEFTRLRSRIKTDREAAYKEPVNHLTKILAATHNYHRIALDLLADEQADLTAVYYQFLDEVCHRFMHFSAPRMDGVDPQDARRYGQAVERAYRYQDELLGELLAAADPDSTVIALSDHGFLNGPDRFVGETADVEGQPGRWHRRYGVLVMAGPPVTHRKLETSSLLDVAPTVLYLAGLPVPDDMDGNVLFEAVKNDFSDRFPPTRIASYEISPHRGGGGPGASIAAESNEEFLDNLRSLGYIGGGDSSTGTDPASAGVSSSVSSHVNLAASLIAAGELDRAEQEILAALSLDPAYPRARKLLFNLRYRQRQFDEAIEVSRSLVDGTDAGDSRFVTKIARAYRQANRLDQGVREYGGRFDRGERQLGALLCRLLFEGGQLDAARKVAQAVLVDDPLNEAAMDTAFNVATRQGRLKEIEPMLEAALEVNRRSVAHLNYLSFVRESSGDLPGAERLLLDALDVDPEHGASLINLGRIYAGQGREDEAIPLLRRALAANPDNKRVREMLERIESGIND
jgi:predicted AlkP superfamily phosphohydrolase/phosphomutase/tetratricopeptide (TPR) repeat protein